MGQTLSSPVQTKKTETAGDQRYSYAISEMQGWRVSMEDAHTTLLKLNPDANQSSTDAFFAVYDGHGGASVARYAGDNLYKRLQTEQSYLEKDYQKALKRAFMGTDEDLRADPSFFRDPSGCTAVAALITHDQRIFVANAGDSRSVLSVAGEAKPLSFDHKPDDPVEYNRIKAAGGYIMGGRVCGNLALSRAIGDFEFKKEYSLEPEAQIITSNPDLTEHQITPEDEFLVLACDGIWDCLSSQQCIDYIRRSIHDGKALPEICETMMEHCLAPDTNGAIGMDNMTILIIAILHGRTLDEWYQWVADRTKRNVGYETPPEIPRIYSQSRIMLASERKRRQRDNPQAYDDDDDDDDAVNSDPHLFQPGAPLGRLFRSGFGVGGANVGVIPNITLGKSSPMSLFQDDSSDDDSDEELQRWTTSGGILNFGGKIEEIGDGDEEMDKVDVDMFEMLSDPSGSSGEKHVSREKDLQGEAPPSPPSTNSIRHKWTGSEPMNEDAHPVVRADGLFDKSEDPLKSTGGT